MHDNNNIKDQSVYQLITLLCREISKQNECGGSEATVLKLRSNCFEILLRKSPNEVKWFKNDEKEKYDAMHAVNKHLFATKLAAREIGEDATDFEDKFNELLSSCKSYVATEEGENLLQFLLALENNSNKYAQTVPIFRPKELLVPGPFTLHASFINNHYYPKCAFNRTRNAEPKYFQSLQKRKLNAQSVFITQLGLHHERNLLRTPNERLMEICEKTQATNLENDAMDCTFTGLTRRHVCKDVDWLRIDMRFLNIDIKKSSNFYALQMSIITRKSLNASSCIDRSIKVDSRATVAPKKTQDPNEKKRLSWSWDQVGSTNGISYSKPFLGESNLTFELQASVCQAQKRTFEGKIVPKEQFIQDLKLLTVGLQSDTFQHNDLVIFNMVPDITIPDILPATIAHYVQEFLDCGTCYKRLKIMTTKQDYKLIYDGFIFKALCEAVEDYLLTFRQFVFCYEHKESLIGLYARMKKPMRLVLNLSVTLAISPGIDPNFKPPLGSQFLGYIYREIMRMTDNDYITLLMFLLKRCCHVYFKYLQLWIFHGLLDDPSKELFIRYQDHYRRNTKYFYDKAYSVRKESVPGFFQGYEERILQCGKYTMLLKSYNPNHPIFELEYPKIAVRLSFDEIQKLEANCTKYAEKALEVCGKPITVANIFKAENKRRQEFKELVFQRSRETMERWNIQQQLIANAAAEEKRRRFEEMSEQLQSARQQRIDKRRESVELELKALREAAKIDEERLNRTNINLRKRVEYYQELNDILQAEAIEEASLTQSRGRRHSFTETPRTPLTATTMTSSSGNYSSKTLDTYRAQLTEDDDRASIYTESDSKHFEMEFAKTAEELQAYCEKRNKEYANNNYCDKQSNATTTHAPLHVDSAPTVTLRVERADDIMTGTLQRSISDVINLNLINEQESSDTGISVAENLNPLQLNRLKTLTGTIGLCFSTENAFVDHLSGTTDVLRVHFKKDVDSLKSLAKISTKAQLEKAQISKHDVHRKSLPDINLNTVSEETTCSELERNRKRMMHGPQPFSEYNAQEQHRANYSLAKISTKAQLEKAQLSKHDVHRKSLPDINLNTVSEETTCSELERNRKRMMHGPQPFSEYNAQEQHRANYSTTEPLSDLQRNRRRVLQEEYALSTMQKTDNHRKSLPDFNLANLPDEMLSARQLNRRRMMESPHPFAEFNKPALSARPKLNLALATERARNRRRVLESEYNIVTGDSLSARELLTPMSTTSDPPFTEQLSTENDHKSDIINGNLRLNISIASKTTDDRSMMLQMDSSTVASTAATLPPATPLEALTTAGVRERAGEGFEFITADTESEIEPANNLNLTNNFDELDAALIELPAVADKWHTELIKNKFQGPSHSSVFRLDLDPNKSETSAAKLSTSTHQFKNFKIDSLNVITLTEFLQKSIIMPMNTHLELVNNEVMRVLLEDLHLIDHFRSLRHYFFMMDGEFGFIICDGIIGRVESGAEPSKVLSYQMLHLILDSALSGSIQKDSNAENLSFIVSAVPAKFDLTSPSVLNVLSLSYRVQWPLNLILNPETLEQYGSIFKYLLKVRRVSWLLEHAFELLRQAAKRHGKRLLRSVEYLRIQQIRHKFYHFVHALQNHITSTALQASWKIFKDDLLHAKSLEDIYRMHTQYIKRIRFLCMLNRSSAEFSNTIENIFRISLKFYNNLKSHDFKERPKSKNFVHPRFAKMVSEEEEFDRQIKYTIYLGNKIVQRGYQAEIGEFITLININQYYTAKAAPTTQQTTTKA